MEIHVLQILNLKHKHICTSTHIPIEGRIDINLIRTLYCDFHMQFCIGIEPQIHHHGLIMRNSCARLKIIVHGISRGRNSASPKPSRSELRQVIWEWYHTCNHDKWGFNLLWKCVQNICISGTLHVMHEHNILWNSCIKYLIPSKDLSILHPFPTKRHFWTSQIQKILYMRWK